MPHGYINVRTIGKGQNAQVVVALPSTALSHARYRFRSGAEKEAIAYATSSLVTFKISIPGGHLGQERDILNTVHQKAKCLRYPIPTNIVEVLNSPDGPRPPWLQLSTLSMSCSLSTLTSDTYTHPLPANFPWFVFLSLSNAFRLLTTSQPRIFHGDLKPDNIIIGFQNPLTQALPEILVVDFGVSRVTSDLNDTSDLCGIVAQLSRKCISETEDSGTGCPVLDKFFAAWKDGLLEGKSLDEVWGEYGSFAEDFIGNLDDEEKRELWYVAVNAVADAALEGEGTGDLEGDLRRLVGLKDGSGG